MFVMGGLVRGGQIHAKWPGIGKSDLVNEDLKVTTDYRDVLANILREGSGLSTEALRSVFPNFTPQDLQLLRS